jgi:catechol 2,3-dioxygenase-like lactoylglutathione lyase family enzyme
MIHALHHVGITVPNLETGRSFFELFGLDSSPCGPDLVLHCHGRDQDQLRLIEGPQKRLTYLSFATDADGLRLAGQRLAQNGVRLRDSPFRGVEEGLWFQDPDGLWVNLRDAPAARVQQAPAPEVNVPGHYRRQTTRAFTVGVAPPPVRPRRLGHLIKFSPDVRRSVHFYTRLLGMKESDRSGDFISFLRGAKGGDHHLLALAHSTHMGYHHLSFEVGSVDEIELGARRLIEAGYRDCFGLGRHVAGSNFFHYVRDPWNSLVEMYYDMDQIPEDDRGWQVLDGTPEQVTAVWARTPPPDDFAVNFEAA